MIKYTLGAAALLLVSCGEAEVNDPDKWEFVHPNQENWSEVSISQPVANIATPSNEEREWLDGFNICEDVMFPKWDHAIFFPTGGFKASERRLPKFRRDALLAIVILALREDSYSFMCSKWSADLTMMNSADEFYNFEAYALKYRNADILNELKVALSRTDRIKDIGCKNLSELGSVPRGSEIKIQAIIDQYNLNYGAE